MAKKSVASTNVSIGANLNGLKRGLKIASSKLRRFGTQAKQIGTTLSTGISAPLIGLGAIAVRTFQGFEAEMSKVKAVSGATAQEFKILEDQAKKLGAATTFTASEVAGLQVEFAKLGFTASEIDKVTESTLYLAQAGGAELGRAAEVAGSTLRAFGLAAEETGRVTDVMAKSFSTSSLDMESFAEAMKTVAPIAKATGVSVEEASAMLGALANNGIKGSIAGTALKKILSELHREGKPMTQTFRELSNQNINLADANDLVGERAKGALLVLTEQMGLVDELTVSYQDAEGAAQAMAEEMMDNTAGAFKILQSATEGALIEIGESITENEVFKGVLEKLTATVGKITKAISGMTAAEQYNKVILAGLLALVPLVITAVGALSIAFGSLTAAMGPVGIAIAGVVLAYQALKKEVTESDEVIKEALQSENFVKAQENLRQRLAEVNEQLKLRKEALQRATEAGRIEQKDREGAAVTKLEEQRIKLLEALQGVQDKNTESLETYRKAMNDYAEEQRKARGEQEESTDATGRQQEAIVSLTPKIAELQLAVNGLDFQPMVEETDEATKKLWRMLEAAEVLSEGINQTVNAMVFDTVVGMAEIGGAILAGEASFKDFGKFALGQLANLFHMLGQLFIEYGLAAEGLKVALSMGPIGGPLAIGAGIALIAAAGAINAKMAAAAEGIPALAEGGIVTGPTLALIGEGRESEAVIPLSKLPQIAGANGGAVEVYGRISGQDILLSSEKAGRVRTRYRGF
jgi:tetratricopeptide (TPR) repeat protein